MNKLLLLLCCMMCNVLFCNAREIKIKFFDTTGKTMDDVSIEVTTSTLQGQWEELRGIESNVRTMMANAEVIFPIDEGAYALKFCFKRHGYFLENWDFPIYSTDKSKNIEKQIIFIPKIKNDDILVKRITLTLHVNSGKKNTIPIYELIYKNQSNITNKDGFLSICLDVSRDTNGSVINAPISNFNATRLWPKSIIVKLNNGNINDGFVCIKNTTIKKMTTAPKSGYSSTLEVNPRKPELFFYCQINGYFGKGIIHSLNQRKDKQWEMTIIFIMNTQKYNNNLQSDFDYDNYMG